MAWPVTGRATAGILLLWAASAVTVATIAAAAEQEGRRLSTQSSMETCATRLQEAMRDLQADVTGPLPGAEYERIEQIFRPLCSERGAVLEVTEQGRRISTAPLSNGRGATRGAAVAPQGVVVDPVLLLDVDVPRQIRPPSDAPPPGVDRG